jgi:acetylxylan esterase
MDAMGRDHSGPGRPPPADAPNPITEVTGFGANPSNLRMHLYVPERLAVPPATVVALHNCTESGPAFFAGPAAEFAALADRYGYLVVLPTATRDGACFDVSSAGALRRDGDSDPVGIVAMVRHVQRRHGSGRVFVIGLSSGAMMTNVLLGTYPDVFVAGAAFGGVPFGGFATDSGNWNDDCAKGLLNRTGREWGDIVRAAFPGYEGRRARVQLWHSTTDEILDHRNLGEAVKQWADLHGLPPDPASSDHPRPGWTRDRYGDRGAPSLEAISVANSPHNVLVPGMAEYTLRFFGLDPLPETPGPDT